MKILCRKDLWWNQISGYSGMLLDHPGEKSENPRKIFIAGEQYEVYPLPERESNGLEYITVYAIGEDGRPYVILYDELHYGCTRFAREGFDFRSFPEKDSEENPTILSTKEDVANLQNSLIEATDEAFQKLDIAKVASWQESKEVIIK